MKKKTIRDLDLRGKRVLLRVDYNVQFIEDRILDDHRLRESIPTIWALQSAGARIIICSHRGRPGGEVVEELRNAPVAAHLSTLLEQEVRSIPVCIGPQAKAAVDALEPGGILLLENLRFHPEEEDNDPAFARALADLADVYVSDAFGTAHRAHASVVGVPTFIPGVAGLLMEREVDYLTRITENPQRPFGLILGGAKVAEKLAILDFLCDRADVICVGGGIANTFLMAQGIDVGSSLAEPERIEDAFNVMRKAAKRPDLKLVLPRDVVISDAAGQTVDAVSVNLIPPDFRILDIGPDTIQDFRAALAPMRTIAWNGPMGLFEREPFDRGSIEVARLLADLDDAITVVGGGETAAAVARAGVTDRISHCSTGGGASLQLLEGRSLPGLEALIDAE
ncbi:MAG: phosphoglycerate kinase [Chloroflexi bacterium]|nr:phosphoglycerate kinase [Chloroflexota bacterium]MQC82589.1 phosphoglycerate kinase [Chloroflexota bacterium]MQC83244.1 phosphoglycerate kinase [Chloroflexota bacterium]